MEAGVSSRNQNADSGTPVVSKATKGSANPPFPPFSWCHKPAEWESHAPAPGDPVLNLQTSELAGPGQPLKAPAPASPCRTTAQPQDPSPLTGLSVSC